MNMLALILLKVFRCNTIPPNSSSFLNCACQVAEQQMCKLMHENVLPFAVFLCFCCLVSSVPGKNVSISKKGQKKKRAIIVVQFLLMPYGKKFKLQSVSHTNAIIYSAIGFIIN